MRVGRIAALFAIVAVCDCFNPPTVCGCPPLPVGRSVIAGVLLDKNNAVVPGATVLIENLPDAPCSNTPQQWGILSTTQTSGVGRFRAEMNEYRSLDRCYRVWAPPTGNVTTASDTQIVHIDFRDLRKAVPDSTELTLHLK